MSRSGCRRRMNQPRDATNSLVPTQAATFEGSTSTPNRLDIHPAAAASRSAALPVGCGVARAPAPEELSASTTSGGGGRTGCRSTGPPLRPRALLRPPRFAEAVVRIRRWNESPRITHQRHPSVSPTCITPMGRSPDRELFEPRPPGLVQHDMDDGRTLVVVRVSPPRPPCAPRPGRRHARRDDELHDPVRDAETVTERLQERVHA